MVLDLPGDKSGVLLSERGGEVVEGLKLVALLREVNDPSVSGNRGAAVNWGDSSPDAADRHVRLDGGDTVSLVSESSVNIAKY